jgi:t-SNARE complex subunit (syntaxin)
MKLHPVEAELIHADRQAMMKLIHAFLTSQMGLKRQEKTKRQIQYFMPLGL